MNVKGAGVATELDFDEFYHATYHRLVGQVYAMTGSLSEAEDSVQEAYARAWQNWGKISGYGDAEAWVRSVAFRVSVSTWRKTVNRFTAHKREGRTDEQPDLSPDRLAIMNGLRRISPAQRQAIVLHHFLDRSVEEISQETGVPTGTVKSRLARGRRALAPHLSEFAELQSSEAREESAPNV
jgi:RNA polymerase sigma-70 factor, ECF subfamily